MPVEREPQTLSRWLEGSYVDERTENISHLLLETGEQRKRVLLETEVSSSWQRN